MPGDGVFSATAVSSNSQPLAGLVNELRYPANQVLNYDSPGLGSLAAHAPFMLKGVDGWRSGIQVQNLGTAGAAILLQFVDPDGAVRHAVQETLSVGEARTYDLQGIDAVAPGWIGSAIVQGLNGQPIAAIVNEAR